MPETCVELVQHLICADGVAAALPEHELVHWSCPALRDGHVCGETPVEGAYSMDHRAAFQDIIIRQFRCPDGHLWGYETDGG